MLWHNVADICRHMSYAGACSHVIYINMPALLRTFSLCILQHVEPCDAACRVNMAICFDEFDKSRHIHFRAAAYRFRVVMHTV